MTAVTHSRPDDGIVDEIAVERVLAGETIALTRTERITLVRELIARDPDTGEDRVRQLLRCGGSTARSLMQEARCVPEPSRWQPPPPLSLVSA